MWTWFKKLWRDEDVAARVFRVIAMAVGAYMAIPRGRSETERIITAALMALGVGIPSHKK